MSNLQNAYDAASAIYTVSGGTQDFAVGSLASLHIDINVSAISGTGATINFTYSRKGVDGIYYPVWTSGLSATGQISTDIGQGFTVAKDPGATGQLSWVIGGTTPSITMSINVQGK